MKKEFYFPSKDGITKIHGVEWIPEGEVKAVLQIAHGMVEHIERYADFAAYMAENGIYVVGHSHLGHGKSMISKEKMGYFASPNGNDCVIGDIHSLRIMTQEKYPKVPYFLMGHSMPDMILAGGKLICKIIAAFKGWDHRSDFVNSLAIGKFEKEMGKGWLSRNEENVKTYGEDPLSGFVFTLNAFYNMFDGISKMNVQEKHGQFPKELPIFFVAGSEDPVGNHGKDVKTVYQRYVKKGAKNVSIKLYPEDRHEILNEIDKEVVYKDLLEWIKKG